MVHSNESDVDKTATEFYNTSNHYSSAAKSSLASSSQTPLSSSQDIQANIILIKNINKQINEVQCDLYNIKDDHKESATSILKDFNGIKELFGIFKHDNQSLYEYLKKVEQMVQQLRETRSSTSNIPDIGNCIDNVNELAVGFHNFRNSFEKDIKKFQYENDIFIDKKFIDVFAELNVVTDKISILENKLFELEKCVNNMPTNNDHMKTEVDNEIKKLQDIVSLKLQEQTKYMEKVESKSKSQDLKIKELQTKLNLLISKLRVDKNESNKIKRDDGKISKSQKSYLRHENHLNKNVIISSITTNSDTTKDIKNANDKDPFQLPD